MKKLVACFLVAWPLGFAHAAVPSPEEQEARANFYRFGEGYTQAAIDLAAASKVRTTALEGRVEKEFREQGVHLIWMVTPGAPDKPVPLKLSVRRKGYLASDIVIGVSDPTQLRRQLGEPDERGPGWMAYQGLAEICSDKFIFRFSGGKLSEVEWRWCTD